MSYLSINKQTKSHLKELVGTVGVIPPIKPQLLATLARHEASTTVMVDSVARCTATVQDRMDGCLA